MLQSVRTGNKLIASRPPPHTLVLGKKRRGRQRSHSLCVHTHAGGRGTFKGHLTPKWGQLGWAQLKSPTVQQGLCLSVPRLPGVRPSRDRSLTPSATLLFLTSRKCAHVDSCGGRGSLATCCFCLGPGLAQDTGSPISCSLAEEFSGVGWGEAPQAGEKVQALSRGEASR